MDLTGRSAIVTGAGGSLGAALVQAFRAAGAKVFAIDVDEARLAKVVGGGVTGLIADVTSPADVARAVAAIGGRVDIACNNAAILGTPALISEVTDDDWRRVIDVNLTGTFNICRAVLPVMESAGGGAIVNIASIAALGRGRANAAYAASKHGVVGLTEHLAFTHGDRGIRCNAICPADMRPPMRFPVPTEAFVAMLGRRQHARAEAAPVSKVASVAVFLASDEAAHINGVALRVDSGTLNW